MGETGKEMSEILKNEHNCWDCVYEWQCDWLMNADGKCSQFKPGQDNYYKKAPAAADASEKS